VLVAGNGDLNVKYYSGKFDAYQRTYIIESRAKDTLHVPYLFRFMDRYVEQLRLMSIGGVIKYIKLGYLTEALIPLPPLAEQRRIAAILDAADVLREKRRQALAKLDGLVQAVFLEMFGDPVVNPYGWPVVTIGDISAETAYGTSEKSSTTGSIPVLRMNNITYSGDWNFHDLKYMELTDDSFDRYTVCAGDLLFNRTNSKELVGKTAVFHETKSMAFAGYLIRVRPTEEANNEYIAGFLNSIYGKALLRTMCKSIIGMANINATELRGISIVKPPIALQHRYADIVHRVIFEKQRHQQSLAHLDTLFTSLQQRAFRGEL